MGSSYTVREIRDCQSLASPGRWAVDDKRNLEDSFWRDVAKRYMTYSDPGTLDLVGSWEDLDLPFPSRRNRRIEAGSDRFPSDQRFIIGTSSRGSVLSIH